MNVKLLLQVGAAGPGLGAVVLELTDGAGKEISRAYVEDWLRRKDAEERAAAESTRRWTITAGLAAIIAALIALGAWIFPIK